MGNEFQIGREIMHLGKCIRGGIEHYAGDKIPQEISPQEGRLLGFLSHHENADAALIQAEFNLSKSSVSELINGLVDKGYLVYQKSKEDGRHRLIVLTEKGKVHHEAAHQAFANYEKILMKGLSEEDIRAMERVFSQIEINIEEVCK